MWDRKERNGKAEEKNKQGRGSEEITPNSEILCVVRIEFQREKLMLVYTYKLIFGL